MRILFITPRLPHRTQGGAAIRNWHLMRAAADAGHTIHLLTFDGFDDADRMAPLRTTHRATARSGRARLAHLLTSREPDLIHRLDARSLREPVRDAIRAHRYDLIQVEGLEMWPALPDDAPPAIYDAHNAEATLQARMAAQGIRDRDIARATYSTVEARKLRTYERAAIRKAAATIAVSPEDAAALARLASDRTIDVVPIGVDTAYFAPDAVQCTPQAAFDVLFTGTMDYRANDDAARWMARSVWPLVRAAMPDARLAIVGRDPTPAARHLDGQDGITVTGSVPDDRPYMAGARVYALPIRFGAGVRVKILNAMSMGCAIVATPAACEGVTVADGRDLMIADATPARFAEAVVTLLRDGALRERLGVAARMRMQAAYDWSHCTPQLLAVYARLEWEHG